MIIKYEKGVSFPVFIHVPDTLPWRLEVDVDNMEDDSVEYVLNLSCCGVEEVLLTSSGFHDLVDTGEEDEDEAILGLFCQILEAATKPLVWLMTMKVLWILLKLLRRKQSFGSNFGSVLISRVRRSTKYDREK